MAWIWLDDKIYPQIQRNQYNIHNAYIGSVCV